MALPLETFDLLSQDTPQIASMNPAGEHFMEDLDVAGGVLGVFKQLGDKIKDNPTVMGLSTLRTGRHRRTGGRGGHPPPLQPGQGRRRHSHPVRQSRSERGQLSNSRASPPP